MKAAAGELVEQCGLFGQCDRVLGRQHADCGTECDPLSGAEQVSRQGDCGGADSVRHEMVLCDPHVVETGLLGSDRGSHRGVQHGGVVLAGKLGSEQKHTETHELCPRREDGSGPPLRRAPGPDPLDEERDDQQSRSSGLWLSSWPRGEMNAW